MCGIAGIVLKPSSNSIDLQQRLDKMNNAMAHRGPDDEGSFISSSGNVGLANRRLAIRDLSPAGHMPMSDDEEPIWITYNGEVYNADMLRSELKAAGHKFRSSTDTEVILKGYKQWGRDILLRLRGMFAFALYDERKDHLSSQLLFARDHLGIKPLYYAETSSAFVFASELKVMLASGLVGNEISPTGLEGYFLTGSVPNPLTIYRDIQSLEPAHLMILRMPSYDISLSPYWNFPDNITPIERIDEAAAQIRELLIEAVTMQLVSDVPLGAFLSGGIDSSIIVALMRKATTGDMRTCSMVFEENAYSEAVYAKIVADASGTNHYERTITALDLLREFENVLKTLDQPSIDGVNTYFVSQTAREAGLTVALSGLGGDELFGGYPNTFHDVPYVYHALRAAQVIPIGNKLIKLVLQAIPDRQRWSRTADALDRPATLASAYWSRRGLFSPSEVRNLLHPDCWQAGNAGFNMDQYLTERFGASPLAKQDVFAWISRAELQTYTHNQLLRDTDVMSMAHSLEVRVPLLDHRLVEAVLRLPKWVKTSSKGEIKPLLLHAMQDYLPLAVTKRQDKQGFTFPIGIWLRGALKSHVSEVIDHIKKQPWINPEAVDTVVTQYAENKVHWSRIWALVALGSIG